MPISGLVLTLVQDDSQRRLVLDALRKHPAMELGEAVDDRVPVVMDTPDSESDRRMWDWLNSLPGVIQIEIAVIHFEEAPSPAKDSARGRNEHEV